MILINIKISSKSKNSTKKLIKHIANMFTRQKNLKLNNKLFFINYFSNKNKHKKISILTSPNANKNAQEQVASQVYSQEINFFLFNNSRTFLLIIKKIKLFLCADTKIQLKLFLKKKIRSVFIKKTTNPDNFKLKFAKHKTK